MIQDKHISQTPDPFERFKLDFKLNCWAATIKLLEHKQLEEDILILWNSLPELERLRYSRTACPQLETGEPVPPGLIFTTRHFLKLLNAVITTSLQRYRLAQSRQTEVDTLDLFSISE